MRRHRDDSGLTLVELLITMLLMGIVGTMIMTVTISAQRVVRHEEDDSQGLADVKVVAERLGRDLRDARGITAGADTHHLQIWIDYNSDYILQPATEQVIWQLKNSTSPGHYDVVRKVGSATEVVEARTLVSDIAFSYSPAAPNTRVVTTSMTYDAIVGGAATRRTVDFSTRLRNVGS